MSLLKIWGNIIIWEFIYINYKRNILHSLNTNEERLDFLKYFYKYLDENELEVQAAALHSFKIVGKFIPSEHIEKEVIPRLNENFLKPLSAATQNQQNNTNMMNQQAMFSVNGPSDVVIKNQILAENLMYMGVNLTQEAVKKLLVPVFDVLLTSQFPEIRIKLFEQPQLLIKIFGNSSLLDIVKKEFSKLIQDPNWRVRNQGLHLLDLFSNAFNDNLLEDNDILNKINDCLGDQVIYYIHTFIKRYSKSKSALLTVLY